MNFDPRITPVRGDLAAKHLEGNVDAARFVEGEERICSPGDVLHFPSNCLHGATMMEEEVVLIDVFTPLREDFLTT